MKLVPYTVAVPEHYAIFLGAMDKALTNYSYVLMTTLPENVLFYGDDEALGELGGWNFDTPEERFISEGKIRHACRSLVAAEAEAESEVEA